MRSNKRRKRRLLYKIYRFPPGGFECDSNAYINSEIWESGEKTPLHTIACSTIADGIEADTFSQWANCIAEYHQPTTFYIPRDKKTTLVRIHQRNSISKLQISHMAISLEWYIIKLIAMETA